VAISGVVLVDEVEEALELEDDEELEEEVLSDFDEEVVEELEESLPEVLVEVLVSVADWLALMDWLTLSEVAVLELEEFWFWTQALKSMAAPRHKIDTTCLCFISIKDNTENLR